MEWNHTMLFHISHTCTYTHMHTHTHTVHTHTHARTHARMHARTHAHTHARMHARTHMHTHTYTHKFCLCSPTSYIHIYKWTQFNFILTVKSMIQTPPIFLPTHQSSVVVMVIGWVLFTSTVIVCGIIIALLVWKMRQHPNNKTMWVWYYINY